MHLFIYIQLYNIIYIVTIIIYYYLIVSPVGVESRWSCFPAGVQEDLIRLHQEPKWRQLDQRQFTRYNRTHLYFPPQLNILPHMYPLNYIIY